MESPLFSIIRSLRLTEDERHRLLVDTEVASEIIAVFFCLEAESEIRDEARNLLDELTDFADIVRITPDPEQVTTSDPLQDFLLVAVVPVSARTSFLELFERPSIERYTPAVSDDRSALSRMFSQGGSNVEPTGEVRTEDLLDRARSFILTRTGEKAVPERSEPLPAAPEEYLSILTLPKGFRSTGVRCGVKKQSLDIGLIVSDGPARAAGRFTRNRFSSPAVQICREHVQRGDVRAIVVNSGVANAATGSRGLADARRMTEIAAEALGLEAHQVGVASTGVIGRFLPMDKIESGIREAAGCLVTDQDERFLKAIMTTDTVMKFATRTFQLGGREVRIGGVVKGAGMIHPNMATMLAFLTSDIAITQAALNTALGIAVQQTFNRLTVDGDTSTSDTVLLLANGSAGNEEIRPDHPEFHVFLDQLRDLCLDLVRQLARDGEGASHLVKVICDGAFNAVDAEEVAETIAKSLLVKTAIFGKDPNWGRIIMAIGNTQARYEPDQVRVWIAGMLLFENGLAVDFDPADVSRAMGQEVVEIRVDLGTGSGTATVYTCDLSYEYVRINAEYTT